MGVFEREHECARFILSAVGLVWRSATDALRRPEARGGVLPIEITSDQNIRVMLSRAS